MSAKFVDMTHDFCLPIWSSEPRLNVLWSEIKKFCGIPANGKYSRQSLNAISDSRDSLFDAEG